MTKKLLAIFAHPDDEAFGPAGTLAKYAAEGVEVHLLCVTRGEAGDNRIQNSEFRIQNEKKSRKTKDTSDGGRQVLRARHNSSEVEELEKIADIREKELLKSARILGAKKVEFLDFIDGTLCNAVYHKVAEKIIANINKFQPQVIVTSDQKGVSGHLDHIAVSMITTYSFLKTRKVNKLYYHCLPAEMRDKRMENYFIYFPEGYRQEEITTRIDFSDYYKEKVQAMMVHESQIKDVEDILKRVNKWPKIDHFILQYHQGVKVKLPETDLFAGIK